MPVALIRWAFAYRGPSSYSSRLDADGTEGRGRRGWSREKTLAQTTVRRARLGSRERLIENVDGGGLESAPGVSLISDDQLRQFIEGGYLVVPDVVAAGDVEALNAEVDRLVATAPPPSGHVGNHFYWRRRADSPALFGMLERAGSVLPLARALTGDGGVDLAFDQAQVALNIPPYEHRPGRPHVDGYQPGQSVPDTFTLLASLLLNDQLFENGGNLWVWPGTHITHAAFFARRGPRGFAEAAGYPDVELPEPTQICGRAGDVLLAHYLLGHNIGGNYESARTRRALYWRLRAPGHTARWAECLADPWAEYPRVKRTLAAAR